MINAGDARLVTKDIQGKLRFASKLNSKDALLLLLRELSTEVRLKDLVEKESSLVLNIYENTFNHQPSLGAVVECFP